MEIEGSYRRDGAALIRGLVSPGICIALLNQINADLKKGGKTLPSLSTRSIVTHGDAIELYCFAYPPMLTFLWGLTPAAESITGCSLLPTYSFFRIYKQDDICKIHSDRRACEHSASLTLGYSDGLTWDLDVGSMRDMPSANVVDDDFGGERFSSLKMAVGDAVMYEGISRRHGRLKPNPNKWSAHIFLHWVDRDGPHAGQAFENKSELASSIQFEI